MAERNFTSVFLEHLRPGDHVLDVGGGDGRFARQFVDHQAMVTIVDPQATIDPTPAITVTRESIEVFCGYSTTEMYQAVFARNVLQFLDATWVWSSWRPWLDAHVTVGGLLAIKTFYQQPEPPFPRLVPSLYTLAELRAHVVGWTEVYAAQYDHCGLDMRGTTRNFFTTDLIVRRDQR